MKDLTKLQERLARQRKCIRCNCIACGREGAGELHDHVCTDGEGCLETQEKLRHRVQMLRYLCGDAADALREAASRLQAPAVAEVEDAIGTLPEVAIRSMKTRPTGDAHLVSQAWVHEGCAIEIRGTNDKAIGWIDTHEWLFGLVYRHHLLPALRTGGSE